MASLAYFRNFFTCVIDHSQAAYHFCSLASHMVLHGLALYQLNHSSASNFNLKMPTAMRWFQKTTNWLRQWPSLLRFLWKCLQKKINHTENLQWQWREGSHSSLLAKKSSLEVRFPLKRMKSTQRYSRIDSNVAALVFFLTCAGAYKSNTFTFYHAKHFKLIVKLQKNVTWSHKIIHQS